MAGAPAAGWGLSPGSQLSGPTRDQTPVPAILEFLPYRLTDVMARHDATHHPYWAGHGYAAVRVDIRGSGNSDGLLEDEYLPQEQQDACEVIA